MHVDPVHTIAPPHALPHALQLAASVFVSTQLVPHSVSPAVVHAHFDAEQLVPAGHTASHAPQFAAFEYVSTHALAEEHHFA